MTWFLLGGGDSAEIIEDDTLVDEEPEQAKRRRCTSKQPPEHQASAPTGREAATARSSQVKAQTRDAKRKAEGGEGEHGGKEKTDASKRSKPAVKTNVSKNNTEAKGGKPGGEDKRKKMDNSKPDKANGWKPSIGSASTAQWSWWSGQWWFDTGNGWETWEEVEAKTAGKSAAKPKGQNPNHAPITRASSAELATAALNRAATADGDPAAAAKAAGDKESGEEKPLTHQEVLAKKAHYDKFLRSTKSILSAKWCHAHREIVCVHVYIRLCIYAQKPCTV